MRGISFAIALATTFLEIKVTYVELDLLLRDRT